MQPTCRCAQVVRLLKDAWDKAGLDLYVAPYGVLPNAYECGIVEVRLCSRVGTAPATGTSQRSAVHLQGPLAVVCRVSAAGLPHGSTHGATRFCLLCSWAGLPNHARLPRYGWLVAAHLDHGTTGSARLLLPLRFGRDSRWGACRDLEARLWGPWQRLIRDGQAELHQV